MKTIAEVIQIGTQVAIRENLPFNMCVRVEEACVDDRTITADEQAMFDNWITTMLEGRPQIGVMAYLKDKSPAVFYRMTSCREEDNAWFNFYVWAVYDLLKKKS